MPKRAPSLRVDALNTDTLPHTSLAEGRELALRAFFYDLCIISANRNVSQGYLSDLGMMTYDREARPNIVKACEAISLASHGNRLQRPLLLYEAEVIHQQLLGSFAKAIEDSASSDAEKRLIAMLLGVYQMVIASEENFGDHETHAHGLAALMKIGTSPLNLLDVRGSDGASNSFSPCLQTDSFFSVPALTSQCETLDHLLLSLESLWAKWETTREWEVLMDLRQKSIALNQRFADWQDSRSRELRPTGVAHMDNHWQSISDISAGFWPGRVDTYFDLYVAGVWNIFRAARLLLISLIIKLSAILGDTGDSSWYIHNARSIAQDIASSIPYHLTDDLYTFLNEFGTSTEIRDPGKSLGGLLLIHPLYVAFHTPALSKEMREYMHRCL